MDNRDKTIIRSFSVDDIRFDIIVQGYPGKSVCHGPLGWSTVAMARGRSRVVLVDVGSFPYRGLLRQYFEENGLRYEDVTDVLLTHCHYDHSVNWVMFPKATIHIAADEMRWAASVPWGDAGVPELYTRELAAAANANLVSDGDVLAGAFEVRPAPGHTPGSVLFVMHGSERDVIFTGDAAKNRMELLSKNSVETRDAADSNRTFELIWDLWSRKPGSIVVPGHDVPMALSDGVPRYLTEREAAIVCWGGDTPDDATVIDLSGD